MTEINPKYDNSHMTCSYSPLYCYNCGKVFGWSYLVRRDENSEVLCHDCFEGLPEPESTYTTVTTTQKEGISNA